MLFEETFCHIQRPYSQYSIGNTYVKHERLNFSAIPNILQAMLAIHRSIIALTLVTFSLCYAQDSFSYDLVADEIPAVSDTDDIEANITELLESAIKLAAPIEELATACETELENNDNKSTAKISVSCLSFQLASNRFEYARIRLNIALVTLSWGELSKVLESWTLRREGLKTLDAAHERIQTLEQLLSQSDDNSPVTK